MKSQLFVGSEGTTLGGAQHTEKMRIHATASFRRAGKKHKRARRFSPSPSRLICCEGFLRLYQVPSLFTLLTILTSRKTNKPTQETKTPQTLSWNSHRAPEPVVLPPAGHRDAVISAHPQRPAALPNHRPSLRILTSPPAPPERRLQV